jgi:uncharacterized protein
MEFAAGAAEDHLLPEMVEVLVSAADPSLVVLFGSRARGTAGPDSDVDLLIVEDQPFGHSRSRRRELARLWRALTRFQVSKDLLVFTPEEIERWRTSPTHVIGRALREGTGANRTDWIAKGARRIGLAARWPFPPEGNYHETR